MPSSWIKGLVTWLSGLIFAVLVLVASTVTSAGPEAVSAVDGVELPGLSATPTLAERTV